VPQALGWAAFALWLAAVAGCHAPVAVDLDDTESHALVTVLADRGIAAKAIPSGGSSGATRYRVEVARSDAERALSLVAERSPRRDSARGLRAAYGEAALVPTPTETRARLALATAEELRATLEAVPGVDSARVQLALADHAGIPLDAAAPPGKASVALTPTAGGPRIPPDGELRSLVAAAVEGLASEDVTIVHTAPRAARPRAAVELTWLGPIAVVRSSAPALRAVLGGALALNVILSAMVIALVRRRRPQSPPASSSAPASDGGSG
jgi:type III secretory pathway lipoprotein EscJ